jgi:hypothetical protein
MAVLYWARQRLAVVLRSISMCSHGTWTKRYFGRQPIWRTKSNCSRTISIDIAPTQVWKDDYRSQVEHSRH